MQAVEAVRQAGILASEPVGSIPNAVVPVGIWLSRSGEPGVCASKGLVLASVLAVWGGYRPAVTRGSRLVASSSSLRSACVSLLRRTSPCSVPGRASCQVH